MPRSEIRSMLRIVAGAGLLAALPAAAIANEARWPGPPAGGASVRVLIAPLSPLFARLVGRATEDDASLANLAVPSGPIWHVLGAELHAPARAVVIAVSGEVEFQTAEIVLASGDVERVDLAGAVRGRGGYALREWPDARDVLGVRVSVRARSAGAAIGFRLVR